MFKWTIPVARKKCPFLLPHSGGTPNLQKGTSHIRSMYRNVQLVCFIFPGVQYSTGQGIIAEWLSARQIIVLRIQLVFVCMYICMYVCISVTVLLRPHTYIGPCLHQVRHILHAFGVDFILRMRLPTSWTCLRGHCGAVSTLQVSQNGQRMQPTRKSNSFNLHLAILQCLLTTHGLLHQATPTNYAY